MNNKYVYVVGNSLYINLTNRCSNKCTFCVRYYDTEVYGDLWLKDEPTYEDVLAQLKTYDLSKFEDVVFCGYGEPTYRVDLIVKLSEYIHAQGQKTRINTNGQGNVINNRDITEDIVKSIDVIGVSLNEVTKEKYQKLCNCEFGADGFDYMLDFSKKCVEKGGNVILSVVDVIGEEDVKKAKEIADKIGAKLRVRELL